jgi:hypothetical protein
MSVADIEQTLSQEASCSRSRADRLDQIPYIIADICKRG